MSKETLQQLRVDLEAVGQVAKTLGFTFSIEKEQKLAFHFGWSTDVEGLWIDLYRDGSMPSTLLALPLSDMKTTSYAPFFFGGEPPAADLLAVTKSMMLFVSQESTPPSDLLEKLQTPEVDEPNVLPVTQTTRRGPLIEVHLTDPVCVDVCAEPCRDEILEIIWSERPDIHLVGIVTSGYPTKEYVTRRDVE